MRVKGQIAVVAVVLIVLAGCADRQEGNDTLPTASTSAETSASLEPLGPADLPMPAEAREQTPEGATAGLEYYLLLVAHQAGVSGQPLRDLSAECDFCSATADQYDQDVSDGNTYSGGGIKVTIDSPPAIQGEVAEFSFALTQAPITVTDENGKPVPGRGSDGFPSTGAGAIMTWSAVDSFWSMNQIIVNN